MMQKFRVWFSEASQMITDDLESINFFNETVTITTVYYDSIGSIEVDIGNAILMQSTGLKDLNGVEIFEGDIVHWLKEFISPMDMRTKRKIDSNKEVHQKESGEWGMGEVGNALSKELFSVEVIGNIYENPELLEVVA